MQALIFILNELRKIIIDRLHQKAESGENANGIYIAFCRYFTKSRKLQFTMAHYPLHIVRKGISIITKGYKMPVGIYMNSDNPFTLHETTTEAGDMLYIYSDGFADQIGGNKDKKYISKRFREFLESISELPCEEQKAKLEAEYQNWISRDGKNYPRMDDVMVIGIRL